MKKRLRESILYLVSTCLTFPVMAIVPSGDNAQRSTLPRALLPSPPEDTAASNASVTPSAVATNQPESREQSLQELQMSIQQLCTAFAFLQDNVTYSLNHIADSMTLFERTLNHALTPAPQNEEPPVPEEVLPTMPPQEETSAHNEVPAEPSAITEAPRPNNERPSGLSTNKKSSF